MKNEEKTVPASEARLNLAFRRVIADVILHNDQVAQRVGIGVSESQFLTLLQLHGPQTPSQLSRHAGLSSGTVTGVLDRLEQLGFIARDRHASDRRKVVVVPNEARIAEVFTPLYAEKSRRTHEVMRRFTPEQLGTIADFLENLVAP